MWNDIKSELIKIFVHKRNFVIIAGHAFFLFLCYLGIKLTPERKLRREILGISNNEMDALMTMIDGQFLARFAIYPVFLVLLPIFISVLAGESVAGEAHSGSLKLYLARPRSRTRIVVSKMAAIFIANLGGAVYMGISTLLVGFLLMGWSDTQIVVGNQYMAGNGFTLMTPGAALWRYAMVIFYFAFSTMALGALGIFFSVIFNRMTVAAVSTITFYFCCYIFAALPISGVLKPFLLSEAVNKSFLLWLPDIPWGNLGENLCILCVYITLFFGGALLVFNAKDIK